MTGHIRHILVRDVLEIEVQQVALTANDLIEVRRPEYAMVEVIRCSMCDMPPVRRPDDMPDYSQVDRLWRTR